MQEDVDTGAKEPLVKIPSDDSSVKDSTEQKQSRLSNIRDIVAFFICGLLNNFAYVGMKITF